MKIDRRLFLAGSGLAALPVPAAAIARAANVPANPLPMPVPREELPESPWTEDPSRMLLDRGWLFHPGDIPFPDIKGHGWSYANAKAGQAQGAAAMNFDDSEWKEVDLPHDWAVHSPFDPDANAAQGYRRRGLAWYRRPLRLEPGLKGKYLELHFGAIATNATIWFNGSVVAHNWSGYNSIYIDITAMARFGDDLNSIVVRVDADKMEGWWYEGAGIYRHVWLVARERTYILTDGIHCDPRRHADGSWTIPVSADLGNVTEQPATLTVESELFDAKGRPIGSANASAEVEPLHSATARFEIRVDDPTLWSVDQPYLYVLKTRLLRDGRIVDRRSHRVGFRTFRFDPDQGFFLNDKPLKIKGTCNHQDHAGVGVAMPDAMWEWRIRRLKQLGCNAIRVAHNAPATELLDACDRLGMLVMDENRNFNISPDYMEQLEWLVRRDRNRASVFMWSVFNEEPMQGTEAGYEMVRRMANLVKSLDDSRPVTAAMNSGMFTPKNVSQAVDVVGFNYQIDQYDKFHAANPGKPLLSSEDTSSFMTRGAYVSDRAKHVMSSYDDEPSSWGSTHRKAWEIIAKRPFVAGTFVWTGFDYHGEPSPHTWPSHSSFFGILDLCGFPKAAFFLHRAQWIDETPLLDLIPHWNWTEREGQPIKVMAFTNVDRVVLSLNGRTVGESVVDRFVMPSWQVPYEPGRLEAVGYRNGAEVIRSAVETTGAPVALRLTPDRALMRGDGDDVQPITVDAVDSKGRHVATANLSVSFEIEGGEIVGLGNGDPNSHEPEQGDRRSLFNGLAQVLVRSRPGIRTLRLRASAAGLRSAEVRVRLLAVDPRPAVPRTRSVMQVESWRQSVVTPTRPDPLVTIPDSDQNSWLWVQPGVRQASAGEGRYIMFRAQFTPRKKVRQSGGTLVFTSLQGEAEIWVDGKRIVTKTDAPPAPVRVPIAAGEGERVVTIVAQSDDPSRVLAGLVFVE